MKAAWMVYFAFLIKFKVGYPANPPVILDWKMQPLKWKLEFTPLSRIKWKVQSITDGLVIFWEAVK